MGRLADALDAAVLGDRCLLNLSLCDAAVLVLDAVADTALPDAIQASQLAAYLRERGSTTS